MSLTQEQRENTIAELGENMRRLGIGYAEAAEALGSTPAYVERVAHLRAENLEDPWVLRNYLLDQGGQRGVALRPFTALAGDYHRYWFLDGAYIDRGRLSPR